MKSSHLSLVAVSLISSVALAQSPTSQFPQPAQSPPFSQHHASTIHEGVLRGTADGVRAVGEANYNTATAALILEEARKAGYANEMLHAETFWNKKNYYDAQIAARKQRRTVLTPVAKPEAAPATGVAPVSLKIQAPFADPGQPGFVWPQAFNHPAFASSRGRLAALFAQRSPADSGPQSPSYLRIQNTTAEMRSTLSDLIREMPPMSYTEARQFLDRAAYEASLPVQLKVAAVR